MNGVVTEEKAEHEVERDTTLPRRGASYDEVGAWQGQCHAWVNRARGHVLR